MLVRFYHEDEIRGVPSGTRIFEVGTVGWKWVKVKPMHEPQWHRIKRKTWDKICEGRQYKVIDPN